MYSLGNIFGYFIIMIVCVILSIILAKKTVGYVILGIGSVIQLLSILGVQKQASFWGTDITAYWVVYFLLLIVGIAVITQRRKKQDD